MNLERCIKDLKMLYGISPHNTPDNYTYQDGYFAMSIRKTYTPETIEKAKKLLNLS